MSYLKRLNYRPQPDDLRVSEAHYVLSHFEVAANEVVINGQQVVKWQWIDTVEVAEAARINRVSGWLLKLFAHNNEVRYHVGIYYGGMEAVLTNVSYEVAQYVVKMIAYYAPGKVAYDGPEGLAPLEWPET